MTYNIDQNSTTTSEQALENIKKTIDTFNQKSNEYRKTKAQLAKEFKRQLEIVLKNFFASSKTIKAIGWVQFTPYFMDGETCTFSLYEVYALSYKPEEINAYYKETIDDEKFCVSAYYSKNSSKVVPQEFNEFSSIANLISNNEIFAEEIWGDHIVVCATEEGITTKEYYDHD